MEPKGVVFLSSREDDASMGTKEQMIDASQVRLVGGRRIADMNYLSARQMESLRAFCDTLLPSIDISSSADESKKMFYRTSASMTTTIDHLAGLICGGMEHPLMALGRFALWLMSTWYGTFVMCGVTSLSSQFPYMLSFPQMHAKKREEVLQFWSLSPLFLHNYFFKFMKFLALYTFFTQVNEKKENPAWKAIGYCGPDPDFINQKNKTRDEELHNGPLYKTLIHMENPGSALLERLKKAGFPASIHRSGDGKSPSTTSPLTIRCDAVVVGSGSGGGVVAGVLAQAGYKIVVLEKGNYFARQNLSLLEGPSMDLMYENRGLIGTDNLGAFIVAGSTVGGGSAINWSASIRTPPHVMDEWCNDYHLGLFGSKAYEQALDAVCERLGVQSDIIEEGFNNMVLRRGCTELDYPVNTIPRNSPPDHYCGWCHLGCKDGKKKGNQETWLVDLVNSGNGIILPGCKALKVLHKKSNGKRVASGVAFEHQNAHGMKEVYVVESTATIIACGALNTPGILKRSGLKNSNIGKQLHIHPTVMAWGYFPESSEWPEAEKKSYEGGIMTAMSTVVANFETSGYGAVLQTPALHPGMFSVLMPWVSGLDMKERMNRFSRTAHIFALARDKGSGRVNYPKSVSYQLDPMDEKNLNNGLEKILRILVAAGAKEIGTHHREGETLNVKQASSLEFERFVKKASGRKLRKLSTPICSAHQMGTCRMGDDPQNSVVNERGETWEVEGLYLGDTSVFPTALGVNPMVTVQAIAYCTAQSIVEVFRRKRKGNYP